MPGRPEGLQLPRNPPEVLLGDGQQAFQLLYAFAGDVTGGVRGPGMLKQPDGFLVVGLGDVESVFEGGLVLDCLIFFHATSVVPFPG